MRRHDGQPKRRWTPVDDKRMQLLWGTVSLKQLAQVLGRTVQTTYWRARVLGLPCGVPDGCEYLHSAAKRTGYTTGQLRRILGAERVRIARTISRPPSRARSYHYVDPIDVDDAVARWLSKEDVEPAARERGLCGDTLRKLLVADGQVPPKRRRRARWRVSTDVIDRVVAEWRATRAGHLSVRQHAKRVGLNPVTLARRLRRAAVLGPKAPGHTVMLPADIVDLALGRAA